jgi:hypothetical protein
MKINFVYIYKYEIRIQLVQLMANFKRLKIRNY